MKTNMVKARQHPTSSASLYLELAWNNKELKNARKTMRVILYPTIAVESLVTLIMYRVLALILLDVTVTEIDGLTILHLKRGVRYFCRKLSRLLSKQKGTSKGCGYGFWVVLSMWGARCVCDVGGIVGF